MLSYIYGNILEVIFINRKNAINSGAEKMPAVFIENGNDKKYKDYLKRHTAIEISLIKKGSGKCVTETEKFKVTQGDIFIFAPNEMHIFQFDDDNYEIITIHTEPNIVWSIGPEFPESELLKIFFEKSKKFKNHITHDSEISADLSRLINDALYETLEKEKEYVIALKTKLVSILVILLRKFGTVKRKTHVPSRSYNLESIENSILYIKENLTTQLDLDMIAESAHLSRSHFCTVFKRIYGISPWDYITIRRIEYALILLEKGNLNKREIALNCGFNNTANFYRAFSKIVNAIPSKL